MTHHVVELRDGRQVGVTGLGDPDARRLVLFCHATPGAGGFDPDPIATAEAGIRMITLDRPGYGSTAADGLEAGPSEASDDAGAPLSIWLTMVDDYLQLVEQVASSIADTEFGKIGVVGWGVGAVYATGLAARHPELVERLALIEPTAPTRARLKAAESDEQLDARVENLDALDPYLGASDRLGFMLESAGHGEHGMQLDHRALSDPHWTEWLSSVTARTLLLSSDDSDGEWYRHRIRGARAFGSWSNPSTTIVEAWPTVLRFLTAER